MKDLRRTFEVIFFVVVLLLSSGAFAPLWTDVASHDQVIEGGTALQLIWACLYAVVLIPLLLRWKTVCAILAANKLLVLLLVLCIVSAAWSNSPTVTLRKAVAIVGTTLLGILLAIRFDVRGQSRLVAAVLGIAAFSSLIAGMYFADRFPASEFAQGAWNGIFSHKNLLGRTMSLGALAFLSLPRRGLARHLMSFSGAALCIAMLVTSRSQTAALVLAGMMSLLVLPSILQWRWKQATGVVLLLLTICAPLFWLIIANSSALLAFLHRDMSLTGRGRIWRFAALSYAKRPWLGFGYGSFWWVSDESRQTIALIGYKTPHAHNGFLDLSLQLGVVGLALFLASWLTAAYYALRYLRNSGDPWPLSYLLFLVLYSFTENSLLLPNSLLWILYVAACVNVNRDLPPATCARSSTEPSFTSNQPFTQPAGAPLHA